ncbi:DUF4873 domain-containing protein [Nocardia sp. NPDC057663]|uniref:DUF4873 domain-containing protein n=1 Tax=Nocardia sp. NPDC057663 TaxID=3346201 RepID=UPI00366F2C90
MTVAIIGADAAPLTRALRAARVIDLVVYEPAAAPPSPATPKQPWARGRIDPPPPRHRIDVLGLDFDEKTDQWLIRLPDGEQTVADIVVLTAETVDASLPTGHGSPPRPLSVTGRVGRTLDAAWADGPITFRGIAVHGFPNLFLLGGPDPCAPLRHSHRQTQIDHVAAWISALRRQSGTRIEVRASTQHEYHRRRALHRADSRPRRLGGPKPHHFDITAAADRHPAYDYQGPAVLDLPGTEYPVIATLAGHADPIDGRYHWYGRLDLIDGTLPEPTRVTALLALPGRTPAPARLTERDPWGNLRITGTGVPPYPLEQL